MANTNRKKITLQLTTTQAFSGVNIVDVGFQSPDENHDEGPLYKTEHVFQYVVGGEGTYTIAGKTYELREGLLFLLPKNVILSYRAKKENPYSYWWVGFDGEFSENLIKQIGLSPDNPIMDFPDKKLPFLFRSIFSCVKKSTTVSLTRATGYMYELFSLLLATKEENNLRCRSKNPEYVQKAISYIKRHYAEGMTIAELANHLGLNRMYFCTIFKKELKVSPYQYLAKYRLEKARKMLVTTDATVTEISLSCGFSSINTFSDSFKAETGWSPLQYRKAKREIPDDDAPKKK